MTTSNAAPGNVDITFYDNFIPSLPAGQYSLTISQALTASSSSVTIPSEPQAAVSQSFIVRGPRFTLDPRDINRQFPTPSGTGVYSEMLPMIVFNQRALPWERVLNLSGAGITDATPYPWLALLVFADGELSVPQPTSGSASSIPAGSQQNPTCTASFPLTQVIAGQNPGPPSGIYGPQLTLDSDEDPTSINVNVIDVPASIFTSVVPSIDDLPFLAHVRQVTKDGVTSSGSSSSGGWYSAIIANRFPTAPSATPAGLQQKNIVHLVSLEGLEALLGSDAPSVPSGYSAVRMISLASWTFTELQNPAVNFRELMLNLISPGSAEGTSLLLALPIPSDVGTPQTAAQQTVASRLSSGYVPLSYQLRTGEQTFAWYRSPLAPVQTPEFLQSTAPGSADNLSVPLNSSQAMIYDPATGLFDQTYAVAFQTGRSLALGSKTFATNLLQWRRQAHAVVDQLLALMQTPVTRASLQADGILDANGNLTGEGITDLGELLNAGVLTTTLADFFASDVYDGIARQVGVKGGFRRSDARQLLTNATATPPSAVPSDLSSLMQDPTVVSLLQYLSGLVPLGILAADLSGSVTSISLNAPGLPEALKKGSAISVTSSDGSQVALFRTADRADKGATSISVEAVTLSATFSEGDVVQLGGGGILPAQVVEWLSQTALLDGVPFNNLVPNSAMLPQESIRFFYVDPNWIDSLLDGAMSIAMQSSRDSLFHQLMRDPLHRAVDAAILQSRETVLGLAAGNAPAAADPLAGFLLRSALVSGWKGIKIQAWPTDDRTQPPMQPLRLETLSPDVLLAIYPGVPQRIEISEPTEGLVFGMEDEETIELRYLPGVTGATASNLGSATGSSYTLSTQQFRPGTTQNPVLEIGGDNGLVAALEQAFPAPPPKLTPASFAVTMVRVPEQMVFEPLISSTL